MRLITTILLLFAVATATAQLYHPEEVLNYRVSYKAKFFPNTEVGVVEVMTTEEVLNGRSLYKVYGRGRTLPAYRLFFSLDDKYTVWVDKQTLRPQRFESDIHEGNYTFYSLYTYNWDKMSVDTKWQRKQEPEQHKTMNITPSSRDAVSLFFNMRSAKSDMFKEGEQQTLELVLQDTIRYLSYRFLGKEQKKIFNMGLFKTLKFACQLGTSEGFSFTDGTEFTVWISDDDNKIPLYIESPIKIGSIRAYISECKGLKYPLKSKIK